MFSVSLWLVIAAENHHRDTENTEIAQRRVPLRLTRLYASLDCEPDSMQSFRLPNEPLVVIQPSKKWSLLSFKDIWAYRELLFFLTWRDVKVRYKQTALGAAWAILQPLFMMIIFTIFFGRLAGVDSAGIPYPLFALAGLVPWTFFANSITASGNSLVGSANLITKVYFPRLIVPAAAMLAGLVDFVLAFLLLVPHDDLLPRGSDRTSPVSAGSGFTHRTVWTRSRNVDVCAKREISRRAFCASVCHTVVAIRFVSHSSVVFSPAKMALDTAVESDVRNHRRLSLRAIRTSF